MRPLDVGHRARMKIEPLFAEDGVPAPANKEINHDENPDRQMIDFVVHKVFATMHRQCQLSKGRALKAEMHS